ncbi:MAG: DNA-processing protein DprA [Betaproteobacteria bacterium]|nr:DNA-processing protein DprA [Betaproteobacteria bacterium]
MTATEHEARAWLELILLPKISLRARLAWLREFGSPGAVLAQSAARLREVNKEGRSLQGLADERSVADALNWIRSSGGKWAVLGDDLYPPALVEHLAEPPLAVFMRGDSQLLDLPAIAIIGGPHPTRPAGDRARTFAYDLAGNGWLVAAGLSGGIGGLALHGALAAAGPLAVIGSSAAWRGIKLGEEVAGRGVVVSEYPPGASSAAGGGYALRHRLLACFAEACVFVEAERRCESLQLAALAGDIGRDVMAVPADPANESGRGCNQLLGEGARLVENSSDILAAL